MIAHPLGHDMECLLWVQTLMYILPQSQQQCMQYYAILDHIITAPYCILYVTFTFLLFSLSLMWGHSFPVTRPFISTTATAKLNSKDIYEIDMGIRNNLKRQNPRFLWPGSASSISLSFFWQPLAQNIACIINCNCVICYCFHVLCWK